LAGIVLGATIALLTDAVLGVSVLTVALVVAVGILVGAMPWLGARGWVPTAALITLVVGSHDTQNYVLAYAGLTLMGAALAVVVNMILPALPLQRSAHSLTDLRDAVAGELDALADSYGPPADAGAHTERSSHRHLDHLLEEMRHAVRESGEAAHANRRARNNARRCGTCAVKRRRSSSSGSSFTTSVFSSTSMSPAADHLARPPRSGSRPPRRCALLPLRCGR
jgi:hypothetical protein